MPTDQKSSLEKQLVSAARNVLSMRTGLSVGAIRIVEILRLLGPRCEDQHRVFIDFVSSIPPGIPVGAARLYWAPQQLMERDAILAEIEAAWRRTLLEESSTIIGSYTLSESA